MHKCALKNSLVLFLLGWSIFSSGCSSINTVNAIIKPRIKIQDLGTIKESVDHAVAALHAKRYREAKTSLKKMLMLQHDIPEVYVNYGYACLGLKEYDCSRASFKTAIDLRPLQTNAYYGLSLSLEGKKDLESALSVMREYIRLSNPNAKYVKRAHSKIQIWTQSQYE